MLFLDFLKMWLIVIRAFIEVLEDMRKKKKA